MPTKKKTSAKSAKSSNKAKGRAAASNIAVWEDDPGDPKVQPAKTPIDVAAPDQSAQPLPFKIGGTTPPIRVYETGTPNFRFYAAASALRRTADFWGTI